MQVIDIILAVVKLGDAGVDLMFKLCDAHHRILHRRSPDRRSLWDPGELEGRQSILLHSLKIQLPRPFVNYEQIEKLPILIVSSIS